MFDGGDGPGLDVTDDGAEFGGGNEGVMGLDEAVVAEGVPVRRKAMPWLAGAGRIVIAAGFPEWTPTPESVAAALRVV